MNNSKNTLPHGHEIAVMVAYIAAQKTGSAGVVANLCMTRKKAALGRAGEMKIQVDAGLSLAFCFTRNSPGLLWQYIRGDEIP